MIVKNIKACLIKNNKTNNRFNWQQHNKKGYLVQQKMKFKKIYLN